MAKPTSTGSRKTRLRLAAVIVAVAVGVVAALAGAAFADLMQADNDIFSPGVQNTITKSSDPGATVTATAQVVVNWSGSKHLTDPQTVTFSKTSTTLPAGASVGDATVSIPDGWATDMSATGTSNISFTAPSTPGDYSYTVAYGPAAGYTCTGTPCLTGSVSFTINLHVNTGTVTDETAPSVTIELNSPNSGTPDGNNGWFKTGPVTGTVTATDTDDNVSSIDCTITDNSDSTSSTLTLTESGIGTSEATGDFSIGDDGNYTISCTATDSNSNTTDPAVTKDVKLDTTDPAITITTPADLASYILGQVVYADYDCTDGTSGVYSCTGTVTDGSAINTSTIGSKSFTVNAEDNAGNTNTKTVTYNVIYDFTGFFQPVNSDLDYCNKVKAGSAIPIKFSLDGYQGMDIIATGYPKAIAGSCEGATSDPITDTETVTSGKSTLNYDSTIDQYIYVWKTDKGWAGKAIKLDVLLVDGTHHYARFIFTK